jgi:phytoene dehydrogenase-like protein
MDHGRQQGEIIVIGAGLGGLASAALLARSGARVRVLDGARKSGGRARSRLQDGFTLNVGPHALYRHGPAHQVLHDLGIPLQGKALAKTGAYALVGDHVHELPYAPISLLRSKLLDGGEKLQFLRVIAGLNETKARAASGLTVNQWLDRTVSSPRMRALLSMLVRLSCYAHAPDLLAADVAIRQVAHAVHHNVMYLDGGWQSLVDALVAQLERASVAIELGATVQQIELHGGHCSAVLLADGRRLPAQHVIAAVDPATLARLLPGDALADRWARSAVPLRAACLDLGVRELPHPERRSVQALDAPLYFANHSAYARLAPDGCQLLGLIHYLAPGEDGRASEPMLRAFVERIQPGVWERAVVKRFMPNLIVHSDLPGAERARCVHPSIARLSLVSDVSSARYMLADAVLDSARAAAKGALGEQHLPISSGHAA